MRIALVIAGAYPALRGSQVLVRHLALGLGERGHVVDLVTYGPRARASLGPPPERLWRDVLLMARLWRTVRRVGSDVIHAHNYEAALAGLAVARSTGCALVYHGHSAFAEELPLYFRGQRRRRLASAIGRFLDGQIPRRADFCIAVTEELGAMLRTHGVSRDGLACISPAGLPAVAAPPARATSADGLVCYAGNLDGYQNLGFLLRAFRRVRARVPGARLVLVTHAEALGVPAGTEGVEIVRVGAYAEVQSRLAAAEVAVCPRVERSGFPMKLLNYMAAGKAIVASAGSAKGLIDGVTGRVVPDGDEEAFAVAVAGLLEDPGARARLGAAARAVVESPGAWEAVLDRVEAAYHRAVAARRAIVGRPRATRAAPAPE